MKKFLVFIVMLFMPSLVMAAEITSIKMTSGVTEVTVGRSFDVTINVSYSDVTKGVNSGYGVQEIVSELNFDETKFVPTAVSAPGFDSTIVKLYGQYYLYSEVSDSDSDGNKCYDKILYCGSYNARVTFFVKETEVGSAKISLGDVGVTFFEVARDDGDAVENEKLSLASVTVDIKKNDGGSVSEPSGIVQNTKPATSDTKTTSSEMKEEETNTIEKSSNNYLSKLDVKGYILNFYKRTNEYLVEIEKGVNNLDVEATLEDKRATLEIKGADNLRANNNKVVVTVTAEDGSKNVYTINVKEESDKAKTSLSDVSFLAKIRKFYQDNKLYVWIGAGVLLLIIVVLSIVNKVSDDKLGRKFDNL